MRRREIDWIRNIAIMMLFVYHTVIIFNEFGDFYIKSETTNLFATIVTVLMFSWYMPLLFFLAGASTYFALQKRSGWQYIVERIRRLLIPLIFGLIVIVPPQTYLARLWRGETNVSYINHLKSFFTNYTDFLGFDGNFTPAHLWFIAFLLAISIVGIGIIKVFKTPRCTKLINRILPVLFTMQGIVLLLGIVVIIDLLPNLGGKGVQTNLLIFILGYVTYSKSENIDKLTLHRKKFLVLAISTIIIGGIYVFGIRELIDGWYINIVDGILKNTLIFTMCITIVGYGARYLNVEHKVLGYLNKASFPVYILHQTILLLLAFYIVPLMLPTWISMSLIIFLSCIITFAAYEGLRRIKPFEILLGMK